MSRHNTSPTSSSSRRQFMQQSAVGAATVAGLSLARSAHAAGDQQIKIGMLGCGGRCSGAAAQALRVGKDVKLVAMMDVFQDRMQAARNHLKAQFPDQFVATGRGAAPSAWTATRR